MCTRILKIFLLSLILTVYAQNEWLKQALEIEKYLTRNIPIDQLNMPQTHNSYNTKPRGYRYENQNLTLTEQLNVGYRFLDLDVHYISQLTPPYRVCHGSSEVQAACASYQDYCTAFGFPDYGDSTGCQSNALTLEETLTEIKTWVDANTKELIIIHIQTDGEVTASDLSTFLGNAFGNRIFTKTDMANFPNSFPSRDQIINLGKSVFLSVQSSSLVDDKWHKFSFWPSFPANKVKYFTGYPECTSNYSTNIGAPTTFPGFFEDLSVIPNPLGGTIYNGKTDVGVMTTELVKELAKCGFNSGFDYATESKLIEKIWHFAVNSPTIDSEKNCVIMNNSLRWTDSNCDNNYHFACKNNIDGSWSISSVTGNWFSGNTSCPEGTSFAVPSSSKDNYQLQIAKTNNNVNTIWIKLTDHGHENQWTETPNFNDSIIESSTSTTSTNNNNNNNSSTTTGNSIIPTVDLSSTSTTSYSTNSTEETDISDNSNEESLGVLTNGLSLYSFLLLFVSVLFLL